MKWLFYLVTAGIVSILVLSVLTKGEITRNLGPKISSVFQGESQSGPERSLSADGAGEHGKGDNEEMGRGTVVEGNPLRETMPANKVYREEDGPKMDSGIPSVNPDASPVISDRQREGSGVSSETARIWQAPTEPEPEPARESVERVEEKRQDKIRENETLIGIYQDALGFREK